MNTTNRSATRAMEHKKQTQIIFMGVVISISLFLSGCGTAKPISLTTEQSVTSKLAAETSVFIFPPQFVFSDLETEASLDPASYGAGLYESKLKSESAHILSNHKIKITAAGIRKEILTSELVDQFQKKLPPLSVGRMDSESSALLQTLSSYDKNMAVLINYVDVKVGSGGTWDPNSGAITMDSSRSEFYSALFQCSTGKLLWKNQVLLRELPKRSSKRFDEAVELLYTNFPDKEN